MEDIMASLYARAQNVAILQKEFVQILIGVALLATCSQITIPIQPVPITMQTVAVMLIGLFYPRATAVKTMLSYLAAGAVGLPVFTAFGGGLWCFMRPTAGYLFGFLASVAVMAYVRERAKQETFVTHLVACVLGSIVMYAFGISWLSLYVGPVNAFYLGFVPFIIPGIIKGLMVAAACKHIKSSGWT